MQSWIDYVVVTGNDGAGRLLKNVVKGEMTISHWGTEELRRVMMLIHRRFAGTDAKQVKKRVTEKTTGGHAKKILGRKKLACEQTRWACFEELRVIVHFINGSVHPIGQRQHACREAQTPHHHPLASNFQHQHHKIWKELLCFVVLQTNNI